MPKTLPSGIATHIATEHQTRALMLQLKGVNGTVIGMTNHNKDISFNLGDGEGVIVYKSGTALLPTQLELSLGLEPDDIDIEGALSDEFTRAQILGGFYNEAAAKLFEVNWANLSDGANPHFKGFAARVDSDDTEFKMVLTSDVAKLKRTTGRLVTPYCDAQYGDARCTKVVPSTTGEIVSIGDSRHITVSYTGTYANDYFNKGTIEFTSGALAGTKRIEIFSWLASGVIQLWTRLPVTPAVGDDIVLRQGCALTIDDCVDRDNGVNFRGFPYSPGRNKFVRFAAPGS